MKITEIRKPLEAKCPICHKTFQEWYCPLCGLPISTFHRKRPEYSSSEFQLCDKCNTPNPYGAKYCKNCGENITLHAKDKNGHGWIDLGLSVLWSTDTMLGYYFWMDSNDYLHRLFRSHKNLMAVNMRGEINTLLLDLSQRSQRKHLESAGVRQNRTIPIHELMQTTQLADNLVTRTQM